MLVFAEPGCVPESTERAFWECCGRKRYKRPQSVLVLVYTDSGRVLLLRRTSPPGFWQSVTGSLGWGESRQRAARRELFEETGLRAGRALEDWHRGARFPIVAPWRARYSPGTRFNREYWFSLRLPRQRKIRLNPREHSEYRWLSRAQALRLASSWTNRQAIRLLGRRLGERRVLAPTPKSVPEGEKFRRGNYRIRFGRRRVPAGGTRCLGRISAATAGNRLRFRPWSST